MTWGKLWVKLRNHAAGGITDKDFALARQIEDTVLWRPEADSALEGTPNKFVSEGQPLAASDRGAAMADRYLFVTGKLAEPALRATLRARRAAVRLRRRGHEDHGRRADDHRLDRPPPRGPAERRRAS